eukprot:2518354-Alexandrium_andersonii.AAC.1
MARAAEEFRLAYRSFRRATACSPREPGPTLTGRDRGPLPLVGRPTAVVGAARGGFPRASQELRCPARKLLESAGPEHSRELRESSDHHARESLCAPRT